jgi:hypothetical protein
MYSGGKVYKEADEFYQCLTYQGCGTWARFYGGEGRSAILELNGYRGRRGAGYIDLSVEAIPEWGNFLDRMKARKASSDADNL